MSERPPLGDANVSERRERLDALQRRYTESIVDYRAVMADIESQVIKGLSQVSTATVEVSSVDGSRISNIRIASGLTAPGVFELAASVTHAIQSAIDRMPRSAAVEGTPEMLSRYREGQSPVQIAKSLQIADLFGDVRTYPAPDVAVSMRLGRLDAVHFDAGWYATATLDEMEAAVKSRVNAAFDREDADG